MGERLAKWLVVQLGKNDSGGTKSLETRCVESLLVVYVCVSLLSLLGAKREFLHQQGANGQSAPPQNYCDYNAAEAVIQPDLPGNSPSNALSLELLALMIVHIRSLSLCADVPNKALNLQNLDIVLSLYLPSSFMRVQQIISRSRLVHGTYENSRRIHPASRDPCFHNTRVAESPGGLGG